MNKPTTNLSYCVSYHNGEVWVKAADMVKIMKHISAKYKVKVEGIERLESYIQQKEDK